MRPFEGRQIPLLPEHTFSAAWQTKIRHFSCSLQGSYTGERSTSDIYDVMKAYFTVNATVGYDFLLKKHKLKTIFNLNNLFNTKYENMPFKAMPGRHLYFTLTYSYNQ